MQRLQVRVFEELSDDPYHRYKCFNITIC